MDLPTHGVVTPGSTLALHPLAVRPKDDAFVVGRVETGNFVVLPDVGVRAIALLQEGLTVDAVTARLSEEVGAPVDVLSFAEDLCELGFVAAIDGVTIADTPPRAMLPWLQPKHVQWLFGRVAKLSYGCLVVAAIVSFVRRPDLFPSSRDFFWAHTNGIVLVANFATFLALLGGHELSHLIAARSLGAPARMTLGTRLHHLVVQTDISAGCGRCRGRRDIARMSPVLPGTRSRSPYSSWS